MQRHPHVSLETETLSIADIKLQAKLQLFNVYTEQSTKDVHSKKQDLTELFEKTQSKLELCLTVEDFLNCLKADVQNTLSDPVELLKNIELLEDNLKKLPDNVDAFLLLEQLKQDIGYALYKQIASIIKDDQARHAKILREKNEAKEDLEAEYEARRKKVGVSFSGNSDEEKEAALAWRYMICHLHERFNDIKYVKTCAAFWRTNASPIPESEWTKHFLLLLNDPDLAYSTFPEHIKNGLKTYLMHYKTSKDYKEHIKLQNSLIGRPTITQFEQGGFNILRISGGYLTLNSVLSLPELADLKNIDEIQILATQTLFLDKDMDDARFKGKNIAITANVIDITTKCTFNTSGKDAEQHKNKSARDGQSFSYSSSGSGLNGEEGKPGNPGESAGHILIQAIDTIKGAEKLHVIAKGGKGGDGQNGGKGDKGQDGQDGIDADYPNDQNDQNYYTDHWGHHLVQRTLIKYGTSGTPGQTGGNGGAAGKGGQGGYDGQVTIHDGRKDYSKIITMTAVPGQDGKDGEPGQGGEAGVDGRQGMDAIRVIQGFPTTAPDEYLKGYGVDAWLEKRSWYLKNLLHARARIPEDKVMSSTRVRTRANGQVGSRAYHKNAAKQKATIHFSTTLSAHDSKAHASMNQQLNELFVLSKHSHILQDDIQQLEKQQATFSEHLDKLKETARSVVNNAIKQRMTQHHKVTQLADHEPRRTRSTAKKKKSADIPFFITDSKAQEKSVPPAFQRVMKIILQSINETERERVGQNTWTILNNRIKQSVRKINRTCQDVNITEEYVYDSLEMIVKTVNTKRALSPADLISGDLYEMSIWHACDAPFSNHMLNKQENIFQSLVDDNKRLPLALSFMQLSTTQLDTLRLSNKNERSSLAQLDLYYQENFYQPKEKILSQKKQLSLAAHPSMKALIDNILFEAKRARKGMGYATAMEVLVALDSLFEEMKDLKLKDAAFAQIKLAELLKRCQIVSENDLEAAIKTELPSAPKNVTNDPLEDESNILLNNTRDTLKQFVRSKITENVNQILDELDQKMILLSTQPAILHLFSQKLSQEAAIVDPKYAIPINELKEILSALNNVKQNHANRAFLMTLHETPFFGWRRAIREQELSLTLFSHVTLTWRKNRDKKRCLFSLCKLEESLGRKVIDSFVECIQKSSDKVDYAVLANLLIQLRHQQLTLDEVSLSLLPKTAFENWPSVLSDYHQEEAKKQRDLETLLRIMQKDAANDMPILHGNPPEIVIQIKGIYAQLADAPHALTDFLFQEKKPEENEMHFSKKPINTWTIDDIQTWNSVFRKQPDGRKLVREHLAEIIAIISQAIFLEKGFYPRDVQYLALLTAFNGSDHSQKMLAQIATGQGKTMTGTMLALLRVFSGDKVDFITSSSVLAEETEAEIRSVAWVFGVTSGCNTECNINDGPFYLEWIDGEPTGVQKSSICSKKGAALIKRNNQYFLGVTSLSDGKFVEQPIDLAKWPTFQKKIMEKPFTTHVCSVTEGLHADVRGILSKEELENCVHCDQSETEKLQNSYRCDILCGALRDYMGAHLRTLFYDENITQNREALVIMDEVDRLLDEMQDILYLSHDIPDMHHLTPLFVSIWFKVNEPAFAEETEENIAVLTNYFLEMLVFDNGSPDKKLEGKIQIPAHLEDFVKGQVSNLVKSAYIAKNGLSRDSEYILAKMSEDESKGIHLIDKETGVASKNKELADAQQFLQLKHQGWPKLHSRKAIYCNPISFLLENYKKGFFGMTGTLGTDQDYQFFKILLDIRSKCNIPRHKLRKLQIHDPIFVNSFQKKLQAAAKIVKDTLLSTQQPIEFVCNTIAEAKALTELLKKETPEASIYTRLYSFGKPFSKGSKDDPIKRFDVIITTRLGGRGTNPQLDEEAKLLGLYLANLNVGKNQRDDEQLYGRTAREDLPGDLGHVIESEYGESSLEEKHAKRDLEQEQYFDEVRKKGFHQNYLKTRLFESFCTLVSDIKKILSETEPGNWHNGDGYINRQLAALRTHWAFWLHNIEKKIDSGVKDMEVLNAEFQVFREKMVERAKDKGLIKLVTGPSEITRLGIWFGIHNSYFDQALQCFDQVINDSYPFAARALDYKGWVILKKAKPDNFQARKTATPYFKRARALLIKELQSLYEPLAKMTVIEKVLRENGQGLDDSQFRKTVESMTQALSIHIHAIDTLIGMVTDPDYFLHYTNNKQEAEEMFKEALKEKHIRGYRISKNVFITKDKKLEILLINGKRREIEFPAEISVYKDKIIDVLSIRKQGDRELRTLFYEDYCKLVFGQDEVFADEHKKILMKLSWNFLLQENVISQPALAMWRLKQASLDKGNHLKFMNDPRTYGLLRLFEEIKVSTDNIQDMSERGIISMEVLSLFKHYFEFDQVIRVDKEPVRLNLATMYIFAVASFEIALGVLTANPLSVFALKQGINDMLFLVTAMMDGDVNMKSYFDYKNPALFLGLISEAITDSITKVIDAKKLTELERLSPQLKKISTEIKYSLPIEIQKIVSEATIAPSRASQLGDAMTTILKQSMVKVSMECFHKTFTSNDVNKNVKTTWGEAIQIGLDFVAAEMKLTAMDILTYSESEQAKRIIDRVLDNTLKEHISGKQGLLSITLSLLSTPEIGKIISDRVTMLTGVEMLGIIAGSAVSNLDKIGATARAITIARTIMKEANDNLTKELEKLKSTNTPSTRSSLEKERFGKTIDEKFKHFKRNASNESIRCLADIYLTPLVSWTIDKITEQCVQLVSKKVDNNHEISNEEEKNEAEQAPDQEVRRNDNEEIDDYFVDADDTIESSTEEAIWERIGLFDNNIQNKNQINLSFKEIKKILVRNLGYEKLRTAHKEARMMTVEELARKMGGRVKDNYIDNSATFYNPCCIYMSYAIEKAGLKISYNKGKTISWYNDKGEKCWAYFRVNDLQAHLQKMWGKPIVITKDNIDQYTNLDEIRGLCLVKYPPPKRANNIHHANGHAIFFEGISSVEAADLREDTLLVWLLPTNELRAKYEKLKARVHAESIVKNINTKADNLTLTDKSHDNIDHNLPTNPDDIFGKNPVESHENQLRKAMLGIMMMRIYLMRTSGLIENEHDLDIFQKTSVQFNLMIKRYKELHVDNNIHDADLLNDANDLAIKLNLQIKAFKKGWSLDRLRNEERQSDPLNPVKEELNYLDSDLLRKQMRENTVDDELKYAITETDKILNDVSHRGLLRDKYELDAFEKMRAVISDKLKAYKNSFVDCDISALTNEAEVVIKKLDLKIREFKKDWNRDKLLFEKRRFSLPPSKRAELLKQEIKWNIQEELQYTMDGVRRLLLKMQKESTGIKDKHALEIAEKIYAGFSAISERYKNSSPDHDLSRLPLMKEANTLMGMLKLKISAFKGGWSDLLASVERNQFQYFDLEKSLLPEGNQEQVDKSSFIFCVGDDNAQTFSDSEPVIRESSTEEENPREETETSEASPHSFRFFRKNNPDLSEENTKKSLNDEEKGPDFTIFSRHIGGWLGADYYKEKMKGNVAKTMPDLAFNKAGHVHCCTIAASYAARLAGWRFPEVPGKTLSWKYEGETCHAFYRVLDFVKYLEEFLGPGVKLKPDDRPDHDGILVKIWGHNRGGTYTSIGHVDYIHGKFYVNGDARDTALYWPWSLVIEKVKSMKSAEKTCEIKMKKP